MSNVQNIILIFLVMMRHLKAVSPYYFSLLKFNCIDEAAEIDEKTFAKTPRVIVGRFLKYASVCLHEINLCLGRSIFRKGKLKKQP